MKTTFALLIAGTMLASTGAMAQSTMCATGTSDAACGTDNNARDSRLVPGEAMDSSAKRGAPEGLPAELRDTTGTTNNARNSRIVPGETEQEDVSMEPMTTEPAVGSYGTENNERNARIVPGETTVTE